MSKKLSQAALKKAIARHNWALQWCWNYEKMQAAGYAYAMVPIVKELYDGEEELNSIQYLELEEKIKNIKINRRTKLFI